MKKLTIEVSDVVYSLLKVLDNRGKVEEVIQLLIDHAQQGVYRPGSWERPWLEQVFPNIPGNEWHDRLEVGHPHSQTAEGTLSRRDATDQYFRRPKKP